MKKKYTLLLCFSILFLGFTSCDSSPSQKTERIELTDDLGRKIIVKAEVKRVVSLTPSVTELVGLICTHDQLVGRSQHCNYPEWINTVSVLNTYPLDIEGLLKLNPDLVLVKDGFISTAHLDKLQSLGVPVYVQKYTSIDDIFRNARIIGTLTGNADRGNKIADSLIAVRDSLKRTIPATTHTSIVLIGAKPICLYGLGSFCDDILTLSGFTNIAGKELNGEFPVATPEYLLCGYAMVVV